MDEYCKKCGKLIITSYLYQNLVAYNGEDGICNKCKGEQK